MKIIDGQNYFRGQDDSRQPTRLDSTQYARAINVRTRNGALEPRRGHVAMSIALPDDEEGLDILRKGKLQAAQVVEHTTGPRMIVVVSGHVFMFFQENTDLSGFRLTDSDTRFDQYVDRLWIQAAGDWVIVQDGTNKPMVIDNQAIYDGHSVPIGKQMAYGAGRLYIVDPTRTSAYASNIWTIFQDRTNLLDFSEEPQGLVPSGIGRITALRFLPLLDTGIGMGPLMATGEKGVWAWDVSLPRDQWSQSLFGRLIASETTVVSDRAIETLGTEVWWRTGDGIETLSITRADAGSLQDVDFSQPVREWLRLDSLRLLHLASSCYHGRTLYFTLRPEASTALNLDGEKVRSWRHRGILVIDMAHRMSSDSQTISWVGADTGIFPMILFPAPWGPCCWAQDLNGQNSCYILEADSADRIHGGTYSVPWIIETRAFDFGQPLVLKQLDGHLLLDVDQLEGPMTIVLDYKPDGMGRWLPWSTKTIRCDTTGAAPLAKGSWFQLGFPFPNKREQEPLTSRVTTTFIAIQVRIRVTGKGRIRSVRLAGNVIPHEMRVDITQSAYTSAGSEEDYLYQIKSHEDLSSYYLSSPPLSDENGKFLGKVLTEI